MGRGAAGWGGVPGGVRQAALVWNAVFAAESVTRVKMGADTELAVANLVPALRLKETRSARPPAPSFCGRGC